MKKLEALKAMNNKINSLITEREKELNQNQFDLKAFKANLCTSITKWHEAKRLKAKHNYN